MNLREKFIWNLAISLSILIILWNIWNNYQLNLNANSFYDKFSSEEVGTDKNLEEKVQELENNYQYRDEIKFKIFSDPSDLNRVVAIDGFTGYKKRKSLYANAIINRGNGRFTAIMNFKDKTFNTDKGDSIAGGIITEITATKVIFKKNDKITTYDLSLKKTLE